VAPNEVRRRVRGWCRNRRITGQPTSVFATSQKKMRREPTDAEAAMWRLLRDRRLSHLKFRR